MRIDKNKLAGSQRKANEQLSGFYNRMKDDVWRLTFSFFKSADMADDITQDVFIKAFAHFPKQFEDETREKQWLLRIT